MVTEVYNRIRTEDFYKSIISGFLGEVLLDSDIAEYYSFSLARFIVSFGDTKDIELRPTVEQKDGYRWITGVIVVLPGRERTTQITISKNGFSVESEEFSPLGFMSFRKLRFPSASRRTEVLMQCADYIVLASDLAEIVLTRATVEAEKGVLKEAALVVGVNVFDNAGRPVGF